MTSAADAVIERVVACVGSRMLDNAANGSSANAATVAGFNVRRIASKCETLSASSIAVAREAARGVDVKAVVAATFSLERRFPSLAIEVASALGLSTSTPAFDLQMACSAYPYAVYFAANLARDLGGSVLIVDADFQSRFLDERDVATSLVMDDAATATILRAREGTAHYEFFSSFDTALSCPSSGPIYMNGFKVFSFVATKVNAMLKRFSPDEYDLFVPHRANKYMVRHLAYAINAENSLLLSDAAFANPGSASIPLTLATEGRSGRALIAGFGAGLSAAAGIVTIDDAFTGRLIDSPVTQPE